MVEPVQRDLGDERDQREIRSIARICVWTFHISPWKMSRSSFGSLAFSKIRVASADEKSYIRNAVGVETWVAPPADATPEEVLTAEKMFLSG